MKGKLPLLYSIIVFSFLTGCEKVIDLKLDQVQPVIVIEGTLTDQNETQTVKISKTYNFDEPNRFNAFSGAIVVLTIDNGQKISFTESKPGIYRSPSFRGRPGTKYVLDVTAEGKKYSATSVTPQRVELTALSLRTYTLFGNSNTYIVAHYIDPPNIQNQYRYILKVNNIFQEDFVSEDRFSDGNNISEVLFSELNDLKAGDRVDVELQSVDRNVFRYFFSIEQSSGIGTPVAPANPVSNFSNGALGIFSAYTSSKSSQVIR